MQLYQIPILIACSGFVYHIPWNVTFLFRRAVPRWQIFEASGETYDNEHEQGTDTTLEKSKTESLRVEPLPIVADSGKDGARIMAG